MAEMKHCERPIRILLGGGIGSGKSIAMRRFEDLGAMPVEADRLGHAVLEPDGEAFGAVSERWPSVVVGGRIDRGALAEIVFACPSQLSELEKITHPAIVHRVSEFASSAEDLVVEIPLILGVPGAWTRVFVGANPDVRLRRAIERGSSEADVQRRMDNQAGRDEWMMWCDKTIDNNGSLEDLEKQIDSLWSELRSTDDGLRL